MIPYIPITEEEKRKILDELGLTSVEQLFQCIDNDIKLNRELNLPNHMSEMEAASYITKMASQNTTTLDKLCFLGCGAYDHYIPAAVSHIISRAEYYTAYTPYQPEISQGTLQTIFEFQSMMCNLTGMDVGNASVYDGATATYEAAYMALANSKKNGIAVSKTVNPEYRAVLKGSLVAAGVRYIEIEIKEGKTSMESLKESLEGEICGVILQSPNFFGLIENIEEMTEIIHQHNVTVIQSVDPISLGLFKSPGEMGVDIAIGEAQSLGNPLSLGGPYLGFVTAKNSFMRKIPGRVVGMTKDTKGKRGFVLTLQTREQHIKRERAISNICSNQALNAAAATVYMALLGSSGLKQVANLCYNKAHYAYQELLKTGKFEEKFKGPFFKEFTLTYKGDLEALNKKLLDYNIIGGFNAGKYYNGMENDCIFAITEKRSKEDIDYLCRVIKSLE